MDRIQNNNRDFIYELIVIGAVLVALGFPGTWSDVIGSRLSMVIGYAAFAMEIAVMLLSSGTSFSDLKVVNLKFAYGAIYIMLTVFFINSMVISAYKSEELISVIRFSTTALFGLWIVDHFSVERMIELTLYAQVLFVLASLALLVIHPSSCFSFENGARSFTGLFTTKNPMGAELSFGIMMQAALYRIRHDKGEPMPRFSAAFLVLQCAMQLTCRALGSLFCVVIPLGYVLFWEKRAKKRLPLGWIYTGVTIGFMVFAMNILPLFDPLLALFGKDSTLTGRTPMWRQFINVMMNHHTFLGFGFSMFWRDPAAVRLFHEGFSQGSWGNTMTYGAHNTLLEMWLDNGLLGLAVFFLMIILCFRRTRWMKEDAYIFCCLYMLQVMLKGLTERSFTTYNYQSLYLFISLGLACVSGREEEVAQEDIEKEEGEIRGSFGRGKEKGKRGDSGQDAGWSEGTYKEPVWHGGRQKVKRPYAGDRLYPAYKDQRKSAGKEAAERYKASEYEGVYEEPYKEDKREYRYGKDRYVEDRYERNLTNSSGKREDPDMWGMKTEREERRAGAYGRRKEKNLKRPYLDPKVDAGERV